jgi:hypothetical protein
VRGIAKLFLELPDESFRVKMNWEKGAGFGLLCPCLRLTERVNG